MVYNYTFSRKWIYVCVADVDIKFVWLSRIKFEKKFQISLFFFYKWRNKTFNVCLFFYIYIYFLKIIIIINKKKLQYFVIQANKYYHAKICKMFFRIRLIFFFIVAAPFFFLIIVYRWVRNVKTSLIFNN